MSGPPGIRPDLGALHAEQAAYLGLAVQIHNDILESRLAGEEPAFPWLMWNVIGLVGEDGGAAEPPPEFRSYYGCAEVEQDFPIVLFTGFDSEGNIVQLRQPFIEGGGGGERYYSAAFWSRDAHRRAGEVDYFHDMDAYNEPALETEPGVDNVVVLEYGPDDPVFKVVYDPETGRLQAVHLGKRAGKKKEERQFDTSPLMSLQVLVEMIDQLDNPNLKVIAGSGDLAMHVTTTPEAIQRREEASLESA